MNLHDHDSGKTSFVMAFPFDNLSHVALRAQIQQLIAHFSDYRSDPERVFATLIFPFFSEFATGRIYVE